jgi:hypothetical protein
MMLGLDLREAPPGSQCNRILEVPPPPSRLQVSSRYGIEAASTTFAFFMQFEPQFDMVYDVELF